MKVSNSEIQTFKRCKRKWWLEYYRRLKPAEKQTGPLALGTRVHLALGAYYTPNGTVGMALGMLSASLEEDLAKIDPYEVDERAKFEKEAKLAKIMVEGYFEWAAETGVDADLVILEAESEIEAEINVDGTLIRLVGKRDAIGLDLRVGTEIPVLVDHKTCQSFNDPMLDLNEQARTYLLLQRLNGSGAVQNVYWNLLRKVLRTARAAPPFYKRESLYVSDAELRLFYERIHGEIRDVLRLRRDLDSGLSHRSVAYPSPARSCSYECPYRIACPMIDADPHFEEFITNQYNEGDPYARYTEEKGEIDG